MLSIISYGIISAFISFIHKAKINKKQIAAILIIFLVIVVSITYFGSNTLERRKHLKDVEDDIFDVTTGKTAHVTGDLLDLKEKIDKSELSEENMNEASQKAIVSLYNYANEKEISYTDNRKQQLIYNVYLLQYQKNVTLFLFGNGYLSHFRELVFEMEFLAFFFNFGLVGLILYIGPFLAIFFYGAYFAIKNIKKINAEYIMLLEGALLAFVLSTLSGYTFFSSSTMMIIIAINVLILNKIRKYKNEINKEDINEKEKTDRQKRIVFGITGLTLGGAERVLVDTVNKLSKDYEITVFTIYSGGEFEKELSENVKVKSLYKKAYNELNKIQKLLIPIYLLLNKEEVYEEKIKDSYDVEIAFLEGPITNLFSAYNKDTRKIAWVHNDISLVFGSGIKAKIKKQLNKHTYSKYQNLVFVSQDNLDKFNNIYNIKVNKQVIYNYLDAEKVLDKAKDNNENISLKKDNDDNAIILVSVARLVPQKGIDRLITVHAKLINDNIMHKIYIVGDGPLKQVLEKQITDLNVGDTFILLGQKENPYPYIKESDVFCLLSNFEGYRNGSCRSRNIK